MATQTVISVYGLPQDWVAPTEKESHGTTYLEYLIPKLLEKKLSKMIDKELKVFHKKCKCESCKESRKRNK